METIAKPRCAILVRDIKKIVRSCVKYFRSGHDEGFGVFYFGLDYLRPELVVINHPDNPAFIKHARIDSLAPVSEIERYWVRIDIFNNALAKALDDISTDDYVVLASEMVEPDLFTLTALPGSYLDKIWGN